MSEASVHEYADVIRPRYLKATKSEKGMMLADFCTITGYHRKAAIRLMHYPPDVSRKRKGRPRTYGVDVANALVTVWKAADYACSKRLAPFLPEMTMVLEHLGVLHLNPFVRAQLITLSESTVDRLLKPVRQYHLRHPYTTVRSPSVVQQMIPTRTFGDWVGVPLGYMETDLVAHCGHTTAGFYLTTLVAVEVRSGWVECIPVWGKLQDRAIGAIDRVRRQVPFKLLGVHTDNGGEFLNYQYVSYCKRFGLDPTHGRAYRKNDQPRVEQRNWQVVRRVIGYDRYATKVAYKKLDEVYALTRLYTNFFQPIRKVVHRGEAGPRRRKVFDRARTPYRRLLEAEVLTEQQRLDLARIYMSLHPIHLLEQIHEAPHDLGRMAVVDPTTRSMLDARSRLIEAQRDEERSSKRERVEAAGH